MPGRRLVFAISADYERRTGGWIYDQRLMQELVQRGWSVSDLVLPAGFPDPSDEGRRLSETAVAALPDQTLVVVDHLCLGVMPELAARHGRRLNLVMIVHHPLFLETPDDVERSRAFAEAEKASLRHVALVVATSHATARHLRDLMAVPESRILVATPGMDPRPPSRGAGSPTLSLLSVGAIVPRKDHGTLLAALSGLLHLPWRLTIVGNVARAPDHVASLRAQIIRSDLTGRITLAGELDEDSLDRSWREADVYVAASRHEGYGMAIAEAVSRGLPVVTTAAGAVPDWLSATAALFVPPGDVPALRSALTRILTDERLRVVLRQGAIGERLRLPSWDATAAAVEAGLLGLMVRRGGT